MSEAGEEISANKVVTFHYRLTDAEGELIESSEGQEPVAYLHGRNNIVPGLESGLRGRRAGDELTIGVAPEDAYGPRSASAVQRVPIKHLVRPGKLEAGRVVAVNTTEGPRRGTVLKVGRFNVDVDMNHPLAGRSLVFEVKVLDVRDATPEEIAHGHAHGPGGAHD
ncbi:MAG: peptidylprolyl isomerase [Gammaproteobacteria bacterium]|nr:peptidylprolyl isomerase [Gammaproteobacteria bacterium]